MRQKTQMQQLYPSYIIIEEIGSGLNLNKKGIKKIIKLAIAGKINELVVAYRDRLTRFGFELIEELIKDYSKGKIITLNEPPPDVFAVLHGPRLQRSCRQRPVPGLLQQEQKLPLKRQRPAWAWTGQSRGSERGGK
jgi:hypothetical protein